MQGGSIRHRTAALLHDALVALSCVWAPNEMTVVHLPKFPKTIDLSLLGFGPGVSFTRVSCPPFPPAPPLPAWALPPPHVVGAYLRAFSHAFTYQVMAANVLLARVKALPKFVAN